MSIEQALREAARFLSHKGGYPAGKNGYDDNFNKVGVSVGYVGNCGPGFDDRSWSFFHPVALPSGYADSKGGFSTQEALLAHFRGHAELYVRWVHRDV